MLSPVYFPITTRPLVAPRSIAADAMSVLIMFCKRSIFPNLSRHHYDIKILFFDFIDLYSPAIFTTNAVNILRICFNFSHIYFICSFFWCLFGHIFPFCSSFSTAKLLSKRKNLTQKYISK